AGVVMVESRMRQQSVDILGAELPEKSMTFEKSGLFALAQGAHAASRQGSIIIGVIRPMFKPQLRFAVIRIAIPIIRPGRFRAKRGRRVGAQRRIGRDGAPPAVSARPSGFTGPSAG